MNQDPGDVCHFVIPKKEIEDEHGIVFDEMFAGEIEALAPMEADGLISLLPDHIQVHERGRLLVRNIAMPFDAYLEKPGKPQNFSRTV